MDVDDWPRSVDSAFFSRLCRKRTLRWLLLFSHFLPAVLINGQNGQLKAARTEPEAREAQAGAAEVASFLFGNYVV